MLYNCNIIMIVQFTQGCIIHIQLTHFHATNDISSLSYNIVSQIVPRLSDLFNVHVREKRGLAMVRKIMRVTSLHRPVATTSMYSVR